MSPLNLSAVSPMSRLGKALRFPLRFIPPNVKLPILQGKLRGKKWIVGSSIHGCWLGSYEYQKRLVFEKTVTNGNVVFDIGAHVGFYTLLASMLVGPTGMVYAFEPVPRNLFYLKEHLRLNKVSNVEVFEAAVSDSAEATLFYEGPHSTMGHISSQGHLEVRTVSLDELVSRSDLPIPHHIKIDVEGAELRVLNGAKQILSVTYPTLFLATHGRDVHQKCCEFLNLLGYHLQPIRGRSIEEADEILAYRIG